MIYYVSERFLLLYLKKQKQKQEKQEIIKSRIEKRAKASAEETVTEQKKEKEVSKYSPVESEKLREIVKRVQINISRWYLDSARTLIIEWLAMSKNNKDLNLLLADIYEREKKYQNAEYIYRDLLDEHSDDDYILQRLWNIYTLRGKTEKSLECYSEALKYDRNNSEILDILSHLSIEVQDYKKALKYAMLFLKEKPRNAEKLSIKWYALEKLWKYSDAHKAYSSVLDLQPYNTEIQERIKSLEKYQ